MPEAAAVGADRARGCCSPAAPTSPRRWWHRPRSISAKNDRNAAIIQLKNALQKNPDLAEARFLLGEPLLETGDVAGGGEGAAQGLELKYPADQVAPALARALACTRRVQEGDRRIRDGRVDVAGGQGRAADDARPGAQLATGNVEARGSGVRRGARRAARVSAGDARRRRASRRARGDLPGALALVETALAKDPTLTDGWQLKGDLAARAGAGRRRRSPPIARRSRRSPTTCRRIPRS